jgi:hypothetical protein
MRLYLWVIIVYFLQLLHFGAVFRINEELTALYCSPNIVLAVRSRRMRWAGHVACKGEIRDVYRVLVGKPERRGHLQDPGVDGRTILRWIFRKWDVEVWTGSIWLRIWTGGGLL